MVLSAVAEDLAEIRFGGAVRVAIGVGLIEERDPEVEGLVDDLAGRGEIDATAAIVAAEAGYRDLQAGFPRFLCSIYSGSPISSVEGREDFVERGQLAAVDRVGHEHGGVEAGGVPLSEAVAHFRGGTVQCVVSDPAVG